MTIPFWCVMAAFALIYAPRLPVSLVQAKQPEGLDNKHPRDQLAKLSGWSRRAVAAHNNAIEAFAPFAAAVFIAHLVHADPTWSARLALLFLAARVLHPIFYIANIDKARTVIWSVGVGAVVGLFALSAMT